MATELFMGTGSHNYTAYNSLESLLDVEKKRVFAELKGIPNGTAYSDRGFMAYLVQGEIALKLYGHLTGSSDYLGPSDDLAAVSSLLAAEKLGIRLEFKGQLEWTDSMRTGLSREPYFEVHRIKFRDYSIWLPQGDDLLCN